MAKTIEQKLVLSSPKGAKIIKAKLKISADGKSVAFSIVSELADEQQPVTVNTENSDEVFLIIDPSKLAGHELLNHKPKKGRQQILMKDICEGIIHKLPAFRTPCMDPSEENGKIVFKPGNKPEVGHSPAWWDKKWQDFNSKRNSRSGNRLERAAYLGTIIKYLIDEENYSVADAWEAVCNDSRKLGHYRNSEGAKGGCELTGSRQIGPFFDLGNNCKIIRESEASGFLLAGGCYFNYGDLYPLADLETIDDPYDLCDNSVGWLVLDL